VLETPSRKLCEASTQGSGTWLPLRRGERTIVVASLLLRLESGLADHGLTKILVLA